MRRGDVVIVGAAETAELGVIPDLSEVELRTDAARRALADCGLSIHSVDGIACAVESPIRVAHHLGITPRWYDQTSVGGCSFLNHVRHAAEAILAGHCKVVLCVHGESGRSRVGSITSQTDPSSLMGQFEAPYGVSLPVHAFTLPAMRFMKRWGISETQLASVTVAQSRWADGNPRAGRNHVLTVAEVLASPVITYPFHRLECCLVTDGGGAVVLTSRANYEATGFPKPPVYLLGSGESSDAPIVSMIEDATFSKAFRLSSQAALDEAGVAVGDVDHLMVYDAFAHLPLYGLQDLGFVKPGDAGAFVAEGRTSPGGELPMNTNGGGICYTHTGMYGMFAILEAVRQLRNEAYRQVPNVEVSLVQGVGGFFSAAATLVLANHCA